jgi:Zn-dependent peptidase ImmA (M78 family)
MTEPYKLSNRAIAHIRRAALRGESITDLAIHYGVTDNAIRYQVRDLDLPNKPPMGRKQCFDRRRAAYLVNVKRMSLRQAAKRLGVTHVAIYYALQNGAHA